MHEFSKTLRKFNKVLTKLDKIEQELQIENTVCSGLNLKSENVIYDFMLYIDEQND